MPVISLIITTYNRARLVAEALESIAASTTGPALSVEVVLVDNNSTDDTAAVVTAIRDRGFPFDLIYVRESQQGTSYARNTGIRVARGEYLVFMDDDQRIAPDYLARVEAAFAETGAACLGGPIHYYNAVNIPRWLAPILRHKGQLDYGDEIKRLGQDGERLGGGNLAFKRSDMTEIGYFDTRLGHHGTNLGGSEDWEIQDRAIAQGKLVVYHPKLVQYHYLRPERYRKRYWRRLYFAYGRSLTLRTDYRTANLLFGAPRHLWWALVTRDLRNLAVGWVTRHQYLFARQLAVWLQLGRIYEARRTRQPANPGQPQQQKPS